MTFKTVSWFLKPRFVSTKSGFLPDILNRIFAFSGLFFNAKVLDPLTRSDFVRKKNEFCSGRCVMAARQGRGHRMKPSRTLNPKPYSLEAWASPLQTAQAFHSLAHGQESRQRRHGVSILPKPPKVCKIMAFMAVIMGLGPLFYILLGV